jgi:hypothetical protein
MKSFLVLLFQAHTKLAVKNEEKISNKSKPQATRYSVSYQGSGMKW